ncbi:peptide/nickel transport system ATP-binding protein [Pseudonocardia thermophila]|uniref:Peptide/nickel transport system ATP-binding protein n=1 Tax=Pseudonocardia thermophila TaxID=1848 RepID=A0A1M6RZ00_PSETH|nr:ATP-binding cassette domain-containing protein [Pseudonocardia thermophila]SHK37696.1 peptide/nickel transport system ATP-binding protein [Pseudonocardia thermophila]
MLLLDGVRFRYGPRSPWVVAGARLAVEPGEIVGLHGPSGVGKSTLGRLAAGLLTPEAGRIEVDGRPPRPAPGRPHPVQLVLQHPQHAVDPRWTIREVLAEADRNAAPDPELVGEHWLDRYPHEVSGGELQRVNLARALLARPRYLVADEISASLDALTQARIWYLLLDRARSERIGVLAISHDRALLDAVASRVVGWAELFRGVDQSAAVPA